MSSEDYLLSNYDYDLPEKLIAQRPVEPRDHSKLLVYSHKTGEIIHDQFFNLPKYLKAQSTLVFNESKVFPCRLSVEKETGAKSELFFLELDIEKQVHKVLIRSNQKKKIGQKYVVGTSVFEIIKRVGNSFLIKTNIKNIQVFLSENAKIPIPPYIRGGKSDEFDKKHYQTLYAKNTGSVAAPTAGLHFTDDVFKQLEDSGVSKAFVNLHVGLGTFSPIKVENIKDHQMHTENYFVDDENFEKIKEFKNLIAVGTTSLRVLESLNKGKAKFGETDIFLHPGVDVSSVQGLLTNFHLPKSSLLLLVSALIGREKTMELYQVAVKKEYRFFSYGDAMLVLL